MDGHGRILLADDADTERAALSMYLRTHGYDVTEARNGEFTIAYLQNHEIDVLLLDLNMPVVDGFDVLTYLQKHRRGLPVILLSGMPVNEIQQHMHGLPERELPPLMIKPVEPEQLIEVLELQLQGGLPTTQKQKDAVAEQ
jgi:DNA-binding response OmpR family regulator